MVGVARLTVYVAEKICCFETNNNKMYIALYNEINLLSYYKQLSISKLSCRFVAKRFSNIML